MAITQTTRELYVFDSAIPELKKLLAAVDADQLILVLDAGRDGVLQLANALTGESSLDAIHIFSHGAAGSLWLGNTVLDQWNLSDYGPALSQIGSALSAQGDLLLYGCDVAQGNSGHAFVEQLAAATGADVAASTDLTGASARGGNWQLEMASGAIESTLVNGASVDYQGTLAAINTSAVTFNAAGASLWGSSGQQSHSYAFDKLVFSPDDFASTGSVSGHFPYSNATVGLDYGLSATNMKVGVPIQLGLSLGAFNLAYPINAIIATPTTVRAGDNYQVATGRTAGSAQLPSMDVNGPSLTAKVDAIALADISGHLGFNWSDVPFFNDDSIVVVGEKNVDGGYTDATGHLGLNMNLLDYNPLASLDSQLKLNNNLTLSKSALGGRSIFQNPLLTLAFKPELNGFDGKAELATGQNGLFDLSATLMQKDPMLGVDIDLDDLAGFMLQKNPETFAAGLLVRQLDYEYRAHHDFFGYDLKSEYDISLFSANASFGVSPALKVELNVEDVEVTLTSSDGTFRSGRLGDEFTFAAPADAISPFTVTAAYSLVGNLKVSAGLVFTGGIGLKAIGAEGKAFGLGLPAFFPDSANDTDSDPDAYLWQQSLDLFRVEWFPDFASINSSIRIDAGSKPSYSINVGETTDIVGAITDPSAAPSLSVSVLAADVNSQREYTVSEGNSGDKLVVFHIERAGDTAPTFTADYSFTFGSGLDQNDFSADALPAAGSVTFAAGDIFKDVAVSIRGDLIAEIDEKLILNLSSTQQVLTPNDDVVYLVRRRLSGTDWRRNAGHCAQRCDGNRHSNGVGTRTGWQRQDRGRV